MASDRYNVEQILIDLLNEQSPFSGGDPAVFHLDETTDTQGQNKNRVAVSCGEPTSMIGGLTPAVNPQMWQAEVTITLLFATNDPDLLDTCYTAIDTALRSAPSGTIVTAAEGLFDFLDYTVVDSGDRNPSGVDVRTATKVVKAVFLPKAA